MMIDIDFEVHKAITALRESESTTPNDVLRRLFKLGETKKTAPISGAGVHYKGIFFPEGTEFRATYKGKTYRTVIKDSSYQDGAGKEFSSPSRAALEMTGVSLNGWLFWECRRPGDATWQLLDKVRQSEAA